MIEEHHEELIRLVFLKTGEPLMGLQCVEAGNEVGGAIGWTKANTMFESPIEVLQRDNYALSDISGNVHID